jgi:hypothetical protein
MPAVLLLLALLPPWRDFIGVSSSLSQRGVSVFISFVGPDHPKLKELLD